MDSSIHNILKKKEKKTVSGIPINFCCQLVIRASISRFHLSFFGKTFSKYCLILPLNSHAEISDAWFSDVPVAVVHHRKLPEGEHLNLSLQTFDIKMLHLHIMSHV